MAVVITPHPGKSWRNIAVSTTAGVWYAVPDEQSQAWLEAHGALLAPGVAPATVPAPATIPASLLAELHQVVV